MSYKISNVTVFITSDYGIFEKLQGNRDVKDERVAAIIDSINSVGYQPVPILVNEHLEVVDGQGRLRACEMLGLPIYFTIKPGIGINECVAMNIKMKNWDIYDFINSYATQGKSDYIRLLEYCEKLPDLTAIEVALCLSDAYSKNIDRPLRDGYYKMMDTDENISLLSFIQKVKPHLMKIKGGSNYYIPVLVGLYKFNLFDEDRMAEVIAKHGATMKSAYNADSAISELQTVYNFHRRHNEYFRDKYLELMEKKGARYDKSYSPEVQKEDN